MKYDFYISGTIGVYYDWWTGQRGTTADDVRGFLKSHKDEEVNIAVSSPGGYIDDGLQICELIKAHGKCNMYIIGMTASAATVLCMKAKSVHIAEGSVMLIHNSSTTLEVWTSANKQKIEEIIEEFKKEQETLDTIDRAIASIYSKKNGKSIDENLERMNEEKWMLAKDALEFGLVDSIIDDEETAGKAKSVRSALAGRKGTMNHYGAPAMPVDGSERKSIWRNIREGLSSLSEKMNSVEMDEGGIEGESSDFVINTKASMKKIMLDLLCGLLAVQEFVISDKGETVLTEDQMNSVENELKRQQDAIGQLTSEKQAAVEAKETAENALAELQKEFQDFKEEAGDDTTKVHSGGAEKEMSAHDLLNSVKDIL